MALAFDTLRAAKQLQQSGFEETQAEAIVSIVSDRQEELATKSDLKILRQEVKADIESLRQETKAEFKNLRQEVNAEFKNLRQETKNLRQEVKADIESLRELVQAYSEGSNKERSWSRWSIGVFAATQLMIIGYILSQLLPAN